MYGYCEGVLVLQLLHGESSLVAQCWLSYVILPLACACIAVQMDYLNRALDSFNTAIVTPLLYVFFTTCSPSAPPPPARQHSTHPTKSSHCSHLRVDTIFIAGPTLWMSIECVECDIRELNLYCLNLQAA